MGPSGAGKTTILNCIIGLIKPDKGRIYLQGKDITDVPLDRRGFGMVFQDFSLFPSLSARKNISFPLEAREMKSVIDLAKGIFNIKSKRQIQFKVDEVLKLVKLTDHSEKKPDQLSGGEQQRVALARALVFDPKLLCLDEPLGSLDKNLRIELQNEIKSLQRRLQKTMLYVTHDQSEAFKISDKIAIVNNGKILQIDTPEKIYNEPANNFVASFVGECNIFEIVEVRKTNKGYESTSKEGIKIFSINEPEIGKDVLGIRPENMFLSLTDLKTESCIKGTIENISFDGYQYRFEINLRNCHKLIASIFKNQLSESYIEKSDVYIDYNPVSILILSRI